MPGVPKISRLRRNFRIRKLAVYFAASSLESSSHFIYRMSSQCLQFLAVKKGAWEFCRFKLNAEMPVILNYIVFICCNIHKW